MDEPMDWKLEVVVVPVADVERAKDFYVNRVGFVLDLDHDQGNGFRVVQMTPPGSGCSVTIGTGLVDMEPGSIRGLQLVVPDLERARGELLDRGVEVSPIRHFTGSGWADGHGGRWNAFVFFSDPDGNGWTVQERPADA